MFKFKILLLVFFGICLALVGINSKQNEFRIRVVANSNSSADQELKEEIAHRIDEYIIKNEVTKADLDKTVEDIRKILDEYNVQYKFEITKEKFPTKDVNNTISSGGKYQTLLITLGKGSGKNYFSILYPEYYGISYEEVKTGEVEFKSYFYELFKRIFE